MFFETAFVTISICFPFKISLHDKIITPRGVIWEGGLGAVAPLKEKEKKEKKKKEKKGEKREKRKKGTMNSVKLLHIKCCFLQFFNIPVALKIQKIFGPPRKLE